MPGQLGPMSWLALCRVRWYLTLTMSCCGMPSVMHTMSGISASSASMMAPAAAGGGTKMTLALAPPSRIALRTSANTGSPRCFSPAFFGFTPPTTCEAGTAREGVARDGAPEAAAAEGGWLAWRAGPSAVALLFRSQSPAARETCPACLRGRKSRRGAARSSAGERRRGRGERARAAAAREKVRCCARAEGGARTREALHDQLRSLVHPDRGRRPHGRRAKRAARRGSQHGACERECARHAFSPPRATIRAPTRSHGRAAARQKRCAPFRKAAHTWRAPAAARMMRGGGLLLCLLFVLLLLPRRAAAERQGVRARRRGDAASVGRAWPVPPWFGAHEYGGKFPVMKPPAFVAPPPPPPGGSTYLGDGIPPPPPPPPPPMPPPPPPPQAAPKP